jgi:hypothetical protein
MRGNLPMAQSSAKESKGNKELDHIRVYPSENSGHVIEHHYASGGMVGYHEPDTFVFGKTENAQAIAHIKKHAGMK